MHLGRDGAVRCGTPCMQDCITCTAAIVRLYTCLHARPCTHMKSGGGMPAKLGCQVGYRACCRTPPTWATFYKYVLYVLRPIHFAGMSNGPGNGAQACGPKRTATPASQRTQPPQTLWHTNTPQVPTFRAYMLTYCITVCLNYIYATLHIPAALYGKALSETDTTS